MKLNSIAGLILALFFPFQTRAEESMIDRFKNEVNLHFAAVEKENKHIEKENKQMKAMLKDLQAELRHLKDAIVIAEEDEDAEGSSESIARSLSLPFIPTHDVCFSNFRSQYRVRSNPLPYENDFPEVYNDNAKLIFDLGEQNIVSGESLLVEVTASVIAAIYGEAQDDWHDDITPVSVRVGASLRVTLNDYITPTPDAVLPLKYMTKYEEMGVVDDWGDGNYGFDYTEDIESETHTVKFFFPDLAKGEYKINMEVLLKANVLNEDGIDQFASFELGPHIVEVSKFRSKNSICHLEKVIDDDRDALVGFEDDYYPYNRVNND